MRLNKLDLNQLAVLDALLAERSVGRAAERMLLSQPAVSCSLARLREIFSDDLLVPVGRTMVLTPLAVDLVKPLRDVLLRMQAFTANHASFDPAIVKRRLKIEVSDYMVEVFIAEVLRRCAVSAPELEFDIRMINKHSPDHLAQGDIDLLIGPDFFRADDQPFERLFDDGFSCVVWEGNSLVGDELGIGQFFEFGHVVTEWGGQPSIEDQFLTSRGTPRKREVVLPGYTLVPQFVIGSRRIATLQTRLAEQLASVSPLRVLACPVEMPVAKEIVQWHRYRDLDPVIRWVRTLMHGIAVKGPETVTSATPW